MWCKQEASGRCLEAEQAGAEAAENRQRFARAGLQLVNREGTRCSAILEEPG